MRIVRAISTGLAVAAAVVLGLMVAPAAHALWAVLVPLNAGTIQAADFSVPLTGSPSNQTQEMTLADGTPATVELIRPGSDSGGLYPGGSVTAGVQILNNTNASSDFNLRVGVPSAPEIDAALNEHLTVLYAIESDLADCGTASYTEYLPSAVLAKKEFAVLCFQVGLKPDTPVDHLGASAAVKVPLHAEQIG